jgi:hypothetical protein
MNPSPLQLALERLRDELRRAEFRDLKSRDEVETLIAQIERDGTSTEPAARNQLRDRIAAVVRRFEVEHPVVTAYLGQISSALAAMGI